MANIQCEINKIFPPKGGKFGMSLKPLEDNEDIKSSNSYKEQYNNFTCNLFIDNDEMPDWAKEGNKISFNYEMNKNWVNFAQKSPNIKLLDQSDNQEESNVVDEIKKAFPDATVETLKDDLDEDTDFNYGANVKDDPIQAKINNYADLYAKIFKTIHTHEYLAKLDTGLKKDIATSFFIQLNR
jgi:hypothetical protein